MGRVLEIGEKKESAYQCWRNDLSISETARVVGLSRNTVASWFKKWREAANDRANLPKELGEFVDQELNELNLKKKINPERLTATIESIHREQMQRLGMIHQNALERSEEILRQRKASDAIIRMVQLSISEIVKLSTVSGQGYICYYKELQSLSKTLQIAQNVFNLATGLATTHLAIDMQMVEKALEGLPDHALEALVDMETTND